MDIYEKTETAARQNGYGICIFSNHNQSELSRFTLVLYVGEKPTNRNSWNVILWRNIYSNINPRPTSKYVLACGEIIAYTAERRNPSIEKIRAEHLERIRLLAKIERVCKKLSPYQAWKYKKQNNISNFRLYLAERDAAAALVKTVEMEINEQFLPYETAKTVNAEIARKISGLQNQIAALNEKIVPVPPPPVHYFGISNEREQLKNLGYSVEFFGENKKFVRTKKLIGELHCFSAA